MEKQQELQEKEKRIEAIRIRIVPKYYRKYNGIDVSEHNGLINWQSVKNSGYSLQ